MPIIKSPAIGVSIRFLGLFALLTLLFSAVSAAQTPTPTATATATATRTFAPNATATATPDPRIIIASPLRINLGDGGAEANAASGLPVQAANGRFIAFRSFATNLVSSATNGLEQVFLFDRLSGKLTLASSTNSGIQGNGNSTFPDLSPIAPSGFVAVAFESAATNLGSLPGLTGDFNIFVHIPATSSSQPSMTEIVSVGAGSTRADGPSTGASVAIVPDPNKVLVVFSSRASNLISGEVNTKQNIYLATLTPPVSTPTSFSGILNTVRISRNAADGKEPNSDSQDGKISLDGRYVVYSSAATNILSGVGNGAKQIYLFDTATNSTRLISKNSFAEAGNGDSTAPVISYTGRYIGFLTQATNLTSDNESANTIAMRFDTKTGLLTRVNSSTNGTAGDGDASDLSVSADGRFYTFTDTSANLVAGDNNNQADIFVKDSLTGATVRTNIGTSSSQANGASNKGTLSGNGFNAVTGNVAYFSAADNLVDNDNAGIGDIFAVNVILEAPDFFKGDTLEVPPDVSLNGASTALGLQPFDEINLAKRARRMRGMKLNSSGAKTQAAGKPRIRFDIRLTNETVKKDSRRRISKRNAVTFKNLKPGTYRARYRTIIRDKDRVLTRTKFSPTNRFVR